MKKNMARQSLRRYLTEAQLKEYQPSVLVVDNNVLIEAEKDIDNILADNVYGSYRKAVATTHIYDSCTFSNNTATLSNFSASDGYYDRVVVEVISGNNTGSRFLVNTQAGNTLTFFEATSLTETTAVKIYQYAKAPFQKDFNSYTASGGSKWSKAIDERIREATAYQYVYRINNAGAVNVHNVIEREDLQGEDYSFSYDTEASMSIQERISPQAWDILGTLTVQSRA